VHDLIAYPNSCILPPFTSRTRGGGGEGIIKGLGKSSGMNYTVGFTSLISNSKPLFPSGSHSASPTFLAKNVEDNSIAFCEKRKLTLKIVVRLELLKKLIVKTCYKLVG
jgi:hypothetical protein